MDSFTDDLINQGYTKGRTEAIKINFNKLSEHCVHRGWSRGIEEENRVIHMCSFKNGKSAKCWEDWQECSIENCHIIKGDT